MSIVTIGYLITQEEFYISQKQIAELRKFRYSVGTTVFLKAYINEEVINTPPVALPVKTGQVFALLQVYFGHYLPVVG